MASLSAASKTWNILPDDDTNRRPRKNVHLKPQPSDENNRKPEPKKKLAK